MRRSDREISNTEEIKKIIDSCMVLRLGMVKDGEVHIRPLNFGYDIVDGKYEFYMHSAKEGEKIDIIRANDKVCVEMDTEHSLIEAEVACGYGYEYSSVMAWGEANIVSDIEEKKKYLSKLMFHQTGEKFEFDEKMVSIVEVIRVRISRITAKSCKRK